MWTCEPCDASNPDDRMFCRICGKMKKVTGWKAPEVDAADSHEAVVSEEGERPDMLAEPLRPADPWSPPEVGAGFVIGWTLFNAVAVVIGVLAQSILMRVASRMGTDSDPESIGWRFIVVVSATITIGLLGALAKWIFMARHIPRGHLITWVAVTMGGMAIGNLPSLFLPSSLLWGQGWTQTLTWMVVNGAAAFVVCWIQAGLLNRWRPEARWRYWMYGCLVTGMIGPLLDRLMRELFGAPLDMTQYLASMMPRFLFYGLATGILMAFILRRARREAARVAPPDPSP